MYRGISGGTFPRLEPTVLAFSAEPFEERFPCKYKPPRAASLHTHTENLVLSALSE